MLQQQRGAGAQVDREGDRGLAMGDCRMAAEGFAADAAASRDPAIAYRAVEIADACDHLPAAWRSAQAPSGASSAEPIPSRSDMARPLPLPLPGTRRMLASAATLAFAALLSACGFQLRGSTALPFETLMVTGADNTPFAIDLRRGLRASRRVELVDEPARAQAVLQVTGLSQERRILSLSAAGRVQEYQLIYRVSFRVHDGRGQELLPLNDIVLRRDITYNDSQVLAKEQEEILLVRDMQNDAVQQVLRRLSAVRLSAS